MNKEPVENQIPVMWVKIDAAQSVATKALNLSESNQKSILIMRGEQGIADNKIDNFRILVENIQLAITKIAANDKKNLLWMFGLFSTFVAIILTINFLG